MADSNAPVSKTFYQLSNATLIVSTWSDGNSSVQLQVDSRIRNSPDPANFGDDQDRLQKAKDKFEDFKTYGRIDLYSSDAMNLVAVVSALLPKTGSIEVHL